MSKTTTALHYYYEWSAPTSGNHSHRVQDCGVLNRKMAQWGYRDRLTVRARFGCLIKIHFDNSRFRKFDREKWNVTRPGSRAQKMSSGAHTHVRWTNIWTSFIMVTGHCGSKARQTVHQNLLHHIQIKVKLLGVKS